MSRRALHTDPRRLIESVEQDPRTVHTTPPTIEHTLATAECISLSLYVLSNRCGYYLFDPRSIVEQRWEVSEQLEFAHFPEETTC